MRILWVIAAIGAGGALLPDISALAGPSADSPSLPAAERALREHACLACHRAEGALAARLAPIPAPDLRTAGPRLSPDFLRRFLADPRGAAPGTSMPDILAGLPAAERAERIEDLVHQLGTRGGLFDRTPVAASPRDAECGAELFDTIGCRACHEDDPAWRARLAAATNVRGIEELLRAPAARIPSGAMPSSRLAADEVRALALSLLAGQTVDAEGRSLARTEPGLRERYYEGQFDDCRALAAATPVREGRAPRVGLPAGHREEYFGVILDGEIEVPAAGAWIFALHSDDGSRLWIDETEVIEHEGLHSPSRKLGTVELAAGWHAIRVAMFEYTGEQALALSWKGPTGVAAEVPAEALRVRSTAYAPRGEPLAVDRERRARGQEHYLALGCAACHDGGAPPAGALPFAALRAAAVGCLDPQPPETSRAPRFAFEDDTRAGLIALLSERESFARPPLPAERLGIELDRLGCRHCHARDGEGGPTAGTQALFTGTAELGDEGRIPPDLTGAGAKLRFEWLRRVIGEGASVRPYLRTRMPAYAAGAADEVAGLLRAVDGAGVAPGGGAAGDAPPFSEAAVEAGRHLVGGEGFRCIDCHDFAGHPSLGEPAVDLATTAERLEPRWYVEYMLDPQAKRPGTRMPAFWAPGIDLFPDILGGSAEAQAAATWSYLSLGEAAPLPAGLVIDRSAYDIVPVEAPLLFGTFFEGLSARVLCCGYPERVAIAYDAEHTRLALAWRGDFINARGTWEARGGALERAGSDAIEFPPGDAVALAGDPREPWPARSGRDEGWRHKGFRRDAARRPVFRRVHTPTGTAVEEWVEPRISAAGATVVRHLRIAPGIDGSAGPLVLVRAAVSASIAVDGDGYRTREGSRFAVRGAPARLVPLEGGVELRIEVPPAGGEIEIEVAW